MPLLSDPVHFTTLRNMSRSAAHYRHAVESSREPTAAMRFGTIVHRMLLGGPIAVFDGERRGKAWAEFRAAANPEAVIATATERDRAMACANAVDDHPFAGRYLVGQLEQELIWRNMGRECSSRPDAVGSDFVTELKTASTTEPQKFMGGCLRLAYHAQLAFYLDAVRVSMGRDLQKAYIVGVESAPPYAVTVLRLTPRTILEGRKLCRTWMERLLGCEAVGEWPGYCQSEVSWDLDGDVELIIDGEEVEAAE